MIYPLLVIASMSAAQAPIIPAAVLNDSNRLAAEHGRRIEQSVICRKDDRIAVTVADGRVTAIQIDGQPDAAALAMTTNAIGDAEVVSLKLTCYERRVMFVPVDKSGLSLATLTLRYRK